MSATRSNGRLALGVLAAILVVFAWSGIGPRDRFTWCLEVFPAALAIPLLLLTHRRFPLTSMAYVLVFLHAVILLVGGHYTYAEVPLFDWIRDAFHLSRNHYDRLGHFAQGFVPAILAREILLRTSPLRPGKWLFVIVLSICLAISAMYELFEYGVAVATGSAADAFLGSQGDVWDTQNDMLQCLIGSAAALALLSRWHDRQVEGMASKAGSELAGR